MRTGAIILLITVALCAGALLYPIGGSVWSAKQVTGLALGTGEQRRELQSQAVRQMAIEEALASARADRLRRWLPGARCRPMDLGFQTADGWVDVRLHCTSGFLFDYIAPSAWR